MTIMNQTNAINHRDPDSHDKSRSLIRVKPSVIDNNNSKQTECMGQLINVSINQVRFMI